MRKCDSAATRNLGLSVDILMEHAGAGVVAAMERRYGSLAGSSAVVACGKGHNGGDGLVVARLLSLKGVAVTAILCAKQTDLGTMARRQAGRYSRLLLQDPKGGGTRLLVRPTSRTLSMLPVPTFVVDAIFGTGFSGKSKGYYSRVIDWMNRLGGRKIAVDVPSGLNADSGRAEGAAFRADMTVTFQAKKMGLIAGPQCGYAGFVEVVDIGMPKSLVSRIAAGARIIEADDVRIALPIRPRDAHKHSVGKILVIAGSVGFAGAATMTAQSAMKAGAGAVILCSPKSLYPLLSRKLTEVMVMPVSESPKGALAQDALPELLPHIGWADVVALGPGLSRASETVRLIHEICERVPGKLLLDADGINAFTGRAELLRKRKPGATILTPHTGEFSRLTGLSALQIERNRIGLAQSFARSNGVTLLLKGAPSVTADPSGIAILNSTGNPGMATAGAGDILTGILAALWAQGMSPADASSSAAFLHGLAGDLARKRFGERSLLALDILAELPEAIRAVEAGGHPIV